MFGVQVIPLTKFSIKKIKHKRADVGEIIEELS